MIRLLIALLITTGLARAETRISTFTYSFSKTYLVETAGGAVLIDPGTPEAAPRIERDIRKAGQDPSALKAVIITHGHADHAGGAAHFQRLGVPVIAGAGDLPLLQSGRNDMLCPTGAYARSRRSRDQAATYPPLTPETALTGPLKLEGLPVLVTPLPGHTPGSLIVQVGPNVFVGDLFRGSLTFAARRHFYMCDLADNTADIRTLLTQIAPDGQTFYPGHFPPASRRSVVQLASSLAN